MFNFIKWNGKEFKLELNMCHHSLESLFWFVLVSSKEEQNLLLIEKICVVLYFLLKTIGVEFFELSLFVIVMLNLSIEIESSTLLVERGLLLLFFMIKILLEGKNL